MAFTRLLRNLARDERFGQRVVPIVPDEARTFGMDSLFREIKIYASQGQLYEPVDHDLLLSYTEGQDGQILEEGITEAGSMASFTAAGTSHATRGVPMVPFFIFYSMFGFQRVGDLIWAAADARARGFLLGATAGRTTLTGEGLQHQDGHSLLLASAFPTVEAYDPAFAFEVALIVRAGLDRMYGPNTPDDQRDVMYYLTLYNETYPMPAMPQGDHVELGVIEGMYRWSRAPEGPQVPATLLFSGTAYGAVSRARDELAERWDVAADLWSVTSYKKLREQAMVAERWNRLHPGEDQRTSIVYDRLHEDGSRSGAPVVAVTDYVGAVPDQVSRWVGRPYTSLGTDGFGRSDTREALRRFFEVDAGHVVVGTLAALAEQGDVKADVVREAIEAYDVDPELAPPWVR
jgi:pyruvate dehydrogenase E1 component